MSTVTVKNLPAELHRALKNRAEAHGRSLNKEIISILESSVQSMPVDASAIISHAQSVRETMGIYMTERELNAGKNEGRR